MVSTSVANLPQRTSRAPHIRPRPPGRGLNGMHTFCQSGRALAGPTPVLKACRSPHICTYRPLEWATRESEVGINGFVSPL